MESKKDIGGDKTHPTIKDKGHLDILYADDPNFLFINKKIERIVSALYMITNFLGDNEPLKWSLRERGLSLTTLALSLKTVRVSDRDYVLGKITATMMEILSLFEIGVFAALLSEMNFLVLRREFEALVNLIQSREKPQVTNGDVLVSSAFFHVGQEPAPATRTVPAARADRNVRAAEEKDPVSYKGQNNVLYNDASYTAPKNTLPHRPTASHQPALRSPQILPSPLQQKDKRQEVIINMLKKSDNLTIKDFSDVITDCSEKTIQRILLSMVADGVLKKTGERRWSRYSLAV